jgi:cytochrome c peroxidase
MQQTSIFRIIAHSYGWLYFIFLCFSANHSVAQSQQPNLSPQAEIGKLLFFEPRISASEKLACATCHDPNNAHAPSNSLAVQLGGINLDQTHFRAVPSIRYLAQTPEFHIEPKNRPVGGFNRDASANSLSKQAEGPLLSPLEMANTSTHGYCLWVIRYS